MILTRTRQDIYKILKIHFGSGWSGLGGNDMGANTKVFVLFFALLFLTGTVFASPSPGVNTGGPEKKFDHPNPLNLTPEQQIKGKEIRENLKKETLFLRNDIKIKRLELKALWTVPKPDRDKILAK